MSKPYPALDLYVLTYNCAHNLISIPHFSSHLFDAHNGNDLPELLVLSLQEATPMSHGLIGGSMLTPYTNRVEDAVEIAARKKSGVNAPRGSTHKIYTKVAQRSIGMVVLMAFALDPKAIQNIRGGEVGLGVSGMANKGAAGLRFEYHDAKNGGETELTFVAAHLAAMESELERRNEDWKDIVKGLILTPVDSDSGAAPRLTNGAGEGSEEGQGLITQQSQEEGIFSPTSHLFLAGDLNYRTSSLKPGPEDHKSSFPQPHFPPGSDQHYAVYFERDQLNEERAAGRTMHGLSEFEVTFPPTYKYDSYDKTTESDDGDGYWAWAEHRWPSWTDRILYLDFPSWMPNPKPRIELQKYDALPLFPTSDHRAVALSVRVPLLSIPAPDGDEVGESRDPRVSPPFEIEAEWRSRRALARKEELMAGISLFLTSEREGWLIVLGTLAGFVAGYFLLKAGFNVNV